MKKIAFTLFALAALTMVFHPSPAQAQNCSAAASEAASSENAEVLNVVALNNGKCEVTLRIPGQNGQPPRVVTKQLNG